MNGHPWPTATPHCKTPDSLLLLGARTSIHVHATTHTHTHGWSIYRLSVDERVDTRLDTAAPVNRDEAVVWSLVAFHPRGLVGWLSGLVPLCLGNACRRQTTLKGEGEDVSRSGISLEEEFEEDSGVRFLFSSLDGGQ